MFPNFGNGAQTPSFLCQELERHVSTSVVSENVTNNERNFKTLKILHCLSNLLKKHIPDIKTYQCVGGKNSSVVKCLTSEASSPNWSVSTAVLQCLFALTQNATCECAASNPPSAAKLEVILELQQILSSFLQSHTDSPSIAHGETIFWALKLSHNLVICSPSSILLTTFISAARPYVFYGLASYRSAIQNSGTSLLSVSDLELESVKSSESDAAACSKVNYNRNRRKRLRRKNVTPGVSNEEPQTRNRFALYSPGESSRMPTVNRPPSSEEMNSLSLKPQWAKSFKKNSSEVQNDIAQTQKLTRKFDDNLISSFSPHYFKKPNDELKSPTQSKSEINENVLEKSTPSGKDAKVLEKSTSSGKDALEKSTPSGKDAKSSEKSTSSRKDALEKSITGENDTSLVEDTVSSSSDFVSDSEGYEGVWSKSTITAKVRLSALECIVTFIRISGVKSKLSLWVPLLCQSPSLLVFLLSEPQSALRSTALTAISILLTDSKQQLLNATDKVEKGAFSSFCFQLGSNIREIHRVLGQTLMSESNTDSIVRTLKTIELLLDNVTYSKLSHGLLTGISRVVKPFICHTESVVKANALSVFVYLLLVKPPVAEMKELLLSYAAPRGKDAQEDKFSNSFAKMSGDENEEFYEEDIELEFNSCLETMEEKCDRKSVKHSRRTFIGWLVGQCVDNLLVDDVQSKGVYVQVQLQSLKLLNSLISEHFSLVYSRLPVIQKLISEGCRVNRSCGKIVDANSCDSGVVVEHVYPVLGTLLSLLKKECATFHEQNHVETMKSTSLSDEKKFEDIDWLQLSANIWVWALDDPLQELLMLPLTEEYLEKERCEEEFLEKNCDEGFKPTANNVWWVQSLNAVSDEGDLARRQVIAAANVLTQLTQKVSESIGEKLLLSLLRAILWLIKHQHSELCVWGVRAAGVIGCLEEVHRCTTGVRLIREAVTKSTSLLLQLDETPNDCDDLPVNKHRLVVVSALANIAATLKTCSLNMDQREDLLSVANVEKLLRTAIRACNDKSRIRPHGVRCLGGALGWLRDGSDIWDRLQPALCNEALATLTHCCNTGSNMKMRWNACHALGRLLASPLPISGSQEWRRPILVMLCDLVSGFHNYKVRIQACGALCSMPHRALYGTFYVAAWKSLAQAANSTQNVTDYLEMRHRDDLVCQVCQGVWHLSSLLTVSDCDKVWQSVLHEHFPLLRLLQSKALNIIPPHLWQEASLALSHINDILQSCDVLTPSEVECLNALLTLLDMKKEMTTDD